MKRALALFLAVLMTMALVACGGTETEQKSDEKQQTTLTDVSEINKQQEVQTDTSKTYKKALKVALDQEIVQIDPQLKTGNSNDILYFLMYNQLVAFDWDTNTVKPELAESWDAESATSYVFHLRKDVTFSNGEPLTADDVVFTFTERPALVSGTTGTGIWNMLEGVDAVDEYTVRFRLNTQDADLPLELFAASMSIFNREACTADPEHGHEIGTAGWTLKDWSANNYVHLVRNDSSWVWKELGETPTEELTLTSMTEGAARGVALQNKEVAATNAVAKADVAALRDAGVQVMTFPAQTLYYYCYNMKSGVFADNADLRKAVAYAVNYDDIVTAMTDGLGRHAYTLWGLNQYGYYDEFAEKNDRDVAKAKEYLTKAGYPNGIEVTLTCVTAHEKIATLMQAQLKEAGITLNISATDSAGVTAAVKEGSYEMLLYNISLQTLGNRFAFICEEGNATNRANYVDPDMKAKFTAAKGEMDDAKRKALYREIQETVNEVKPYVPIYYATANVGWCEGVTGIIWSADTKADFTSIRWEE